MWDTETPASPNRPMMARLRYPAAAVLVVVVLVRVVPIIGSAAAFPILTGFLAIGFATWVGWRWLVSARVDVPERERLVGSAGWSAFWVVVALAWTGLALLVGTYRPVLLLVPLLSVAALLVAVHGVRRHDRREDAAREREGRAG